MSNTDQYADTQSHDIIFKQAMIAENTYNNPMTDMPSLITEENSVRLYGTLELQDCKPITVTESFLLSLLGCAPSQIRILAMPDDEIKKSVIRLVTELRPLTLKYLSKDSLYALFHSRETRLGNILLNTPELLTENMFTKLHNTYCSFDISTSCSLVQRCKYAIPWVFENAVISLKRRKHKKLNELSQLYYCIIEYYPQETTVIDCILTNYDEYVIGVFE